MFQLDTLLIPSGVVVECLHYLILPTNYGKDSELEHGNDHYENRKIVYMEFITIILGTVKNVIESYKRVLSPL